MKMSTELGRFIGISLKSCDKDKHGPRSEIDWIQLESRSVRLLSYVWI